MLSFSSLFSFENSPLSDDVVESMPDDIVRLIDQPLADTEDLAKERLKYLANTLGELDQEYLDAFKNILINNSIEGFETYFPEQNTAEFNTIYANATIRHDFHAMSYILDSFSIAALEALAKSLGIEI